MSDDKERVHVSPDGMDELIRRDLLRKAGFGAVVLVYGAHGRQERGGRRAEVPRQGAGGHAPDHPVEPFRAGVRPLVRRPVRQGVGREERHRGARSTTSTSPSCPTRAAAEVAAQSGHDLFQFLSPPAAYEDQVVSVNDIVQEVSARSARWGASGCKSTYNPRTKKYFGFPDNYVPDPVHYRRDIWARDRGGAELAGTTSAAAAPRLKAMGRPIGIGMSQELDSNMAMIALMQCYGGYIQNQPRPASSSTARARATRSPRCGTSTRTA